MLFLTILMLGSCAAVQAQTQEAARSMKKCWEYAAEPKERGILADETAVYLAEPGGRLEAVAMDSGSRLWSDDLGGEIVSNIVETDTALFAVTRSSAGPAAGKPKAALRSFSKTTGITNWVAEIAGGESVFLGPAKDIIIAIADNGTVSASDLRDGSPRWSTDLGSAVTVEPRFSAGHLITATATDVLVLAADNGAPLVKKRSAFRPTAVALVDDGDKAAWGDERGNLYLFAVDSQKTIWKIKHGGAISDLADMGETVLAASNDNFVYSVALYNGNVRWKRRQPDRLFPSVLIDPGLVVLLSRSGGTAMILERDHGKPVDNIALGADTSFTGPATAAGARIVIPVPGRLMAYSLGGCSGK